MISGGGRRGAREVAEFSPARAGDWGWEGLWRGDAVHREVKAGGRCHNLLVGSARAANAERVWTVCSGAVWPAVTVGLNGGEGGPPAAGAEEAAEARESAQAARERGPPPAMTTMMGKTRHAGGACCYGALPF